MIRNIFAKNKKATRHWLGQRVSAVAMLLVGTYLVVTITRGDLTALMEPTSWAGNYGIVVVALLLWLVFDHARFGVDVVIEDYVHKPSRRRMVMLGNGLLAWGCKILTVVLAYRLFVGIG